MTPERRLSAMSLLLVLLAAARAALRSHTDLALENLALRQQPACSATPTGLDVTGARFDRHAGRSKEEPLRQPVTTPNSRPIAAVTAIASPPPSVTRSVALPIGAPPS